MTLVAESDSLHARVRAFAATSLAGSGPVETFDEIALDIARFQARHLPGVRRLIEAAGRSPTTIEDVPGVPVEAFRLARVAVHPPELDEVRFETSGTTGALPGVHAMRRTDTYRELSVGWGRRALLASRAGPRTVVSLAPEPGPAQASSLGFMMGAFMEEFAGRGLHPLRSREGPCAARWLASPAGIDLDRLRRAAELADGREEPLLVLATGFALVLLLDALRGADVGVREDTVVMCTGGTKGRTREVAAAALVSDAARAFGIPEARVVGEYGMTELTSQLYEGTLPGGDLRAPRGMFVPPPWLSVVAVDPETLAPVARGEEGIARFVDLGNVDSSVAIVTQDRVRLAGAGVELLGRRVGAPPRGCSLAVEHMVFGDPG